MDRPRASGTRRRGVPGATASLVGTGNCRKQWHPIVANPRSPDWCRFALKATPGMPKAKLHTGN
eukprot:907079-Alexandrium_andersonii.AAC.1